MSIGVLNEEIRETYSWSSALVVASALGLFTFITFTANNTPSMPHGYNLVYVTGTATMALLISGIWLIVSGFKLKNT